MNKQEIEKALSWVKEVINHQVFERATYEDTYGTGDLSEEERKEVYEEMDNNINLFKTIQCALTQQLNSGWIPVDSLELMRKINNGIAEVCNEHPYKVVGEMDTYSQYNEGWNDACDRIQSKITDILFEQSLSEPYKEDKDAERN